MLRLEAVRVRSGAFELTADLQVRRGGICAVMGPSGAGKSTLLSLIAGFLQPESGRVLWDGHDLGPLAPGERPLSILFQDHNLFPHLTAGQNVGLGLRSDLRLAPAERAAVDEAMATVGLEGLGDRRPSMLSGGQQGRAALARTLLRARPLLLLDEPFAALGPALRAEMLDLVRALAAARGTTVLMVSHHPQDARRIADDVLWVDQGRAVPPRPVAEVLDDPRGPVADYLGK